jgi:beta-phosphoglucomutase-like phosphatase (HAD superfamily)
VLDGFNIAKYFEVIVGGDVVPFRKPDPRHLLTALEQLRASPNESVMIGDNENDHAAARGRRCGHSHAVWLSARAAGNARAGCVARSVCRHPASARPNQSKKVARITSRAALKKSGIRAAANDARESLGFQDEQKRRRAGTAICSSFLGPIETELLAAA